SGTSNLLLDAAFNGTTYCVTGGVRTVLTSTNASSWNGNSSLDQSSLWFERLAWGKAVFVGVGVQGTILLSPDGQNWAQANSGTTQELRGVAYGNNLFVTVGVNGTILTSPLAKPTILKQPKPVSVKAGATAQFKVTALGAGKLKYQWKKGSQ